MDQLVHRVWAQELWKVLKTKRLLNKSAIKVGTSPWKYTYRCRYHKRSSYKLHLTAGENWHYFSRIYDLKEEWTLTHQPPILGENVNIESLSLHDISCFIPHITLYITELLAVITVAVYISADNWISWRTNHINQTSTKHFKIHPMLIWKHNNSAITIATFSGYGTTRALLFGRRYNEQF